jgi:hypothetical protein
VLKDKQAARQKLADRLSIAQTLFAENRAAAERLAVARASAQLQLCRSRCSRSLRLVKILACRNQHERSRRCDQSQAL